MINSYKYIYNFCSQNVTVFCKTPLIHAKNKIYGPSHHTAMAALKTEAKYLANAVFRHAMQKSCL